MRTIVPIVFLVISLLFLQGYAYTGSKAIRLAYMSAVAYESIDSISKWNCGPCGKFPLTQVQPFSNTSSQTQGFTGYAKDINAIIVSFRGTTNVRNWLSNLDTVRISYPQCSGCGVHKGFAYTYGSVANIVKSQVSKLLASHSSASIMVTGHSLGGAMATLCALDIKNSIKAVSDLYTFGQPRVGQSNWVKYMTSTIPNTNRVIHYADIVPHVPPSAFGFAHALAEIWFTKDMSKYQICIAEDPKCSNSLGGLGYTADDHDMTNYYLKVSSNVSIYEYIKNLLNENVLGLLHKDSQIGKVSQTIQQLQLQGVDEAYHKMGITPKWEQKIGKVSQTIQQLQLQGVDEAYHKMGITPKWEQKIILK